MEWWLLCLAFPVVYPGKVVQSKLMPIRAAGRPQETPNITATIPFYPRLSQWIAKDPARFGVKLFLSNGISLGHMLYKNSPNVPPKDVIYQINCNDCQANYVGKTAWHLSHQLKEHQSDVRKCAGGTALSKHAAKTGHSFNFEDHKIVHRARNGKCLAALEQLAIVSTKSAVNYPDFAPHPCFKGLLGVR